MGDDEPQSSCYDAIASALTIEVSSYSALISSMKAWQISSSIPIVFCVTAVAAARRRRNAITRPCSRVETHADRNETRLTASCSAVVSWTRKGVVLRPRDVTVCRDGKFRRDRGTETREVNLLSMDQMLRAVAGANAGTKRTRARFPIMSATGRTFSIFFGPSLAGCTSRRRSTRITMS